MNNSNFFIKWPVKLLISWLILGSYLFAGELATNKKTDSGKFESITYTVQFMTGENGLIKGRAIQKVKHGGNCTPVTAKPKAHCNFTNWTGDYAGTDSLLTITNVTSNMQITANFACDNYTVTFVEGSNGNIAGTLVQNIAYGESCTAVTANPDASYVFIGWSGDSYEGTVNPLTISNVSSDMTLTANFAVQADIPRMVAGSRFNIDQSEITNLSQFTHKPTIYGAYYDPVKDPNEKRVKKASAMVYSEPNSAIPLDNVNCIWTRKILLYNIRDLRKAYKVGDTCETFLVANPINELMVSLYVKTTEKKLLYNQTTKNFFIEKRIRPFYMTPPTITAVRDASDTSDITEATLTQIFIIKGTYFSKNRYASTPKIWLEYTDDKNKTKKLRLKVLKPYTYNNFKGFAESSCMNIDNGTSEICVQIPSKWPEGWNHSVDHNIVIDNGSGLVTVDFQTAE
jgi:uncharacterized repeat protein (TIGR02543 family)